MIIRIVQCEPYLFVPEKGQKPEKLGGKVNKMQHQRVSVQLKPTDDFLRSKRAASILPAQARFLLEDGRPPVRWLSQAR